jgi:hypothetical protein
MFVVLTVDGWAVTISDHTSGESFSIGQWPTPEAAKEAAIRFAFSQSHKEHVVWIQGFPADGSLDVESQ